MSYSTSPAGGAGLNQASAHDTGLYDPERHDNQIVAMYDTDAEARAAKDALANAGVSGSAVQVVARGSETGTMGGVNAEDNNGGVWSAIKSLFVPDEDRSAYSHAVGRGHAMVVVNPTSGMDRQKIIHALESTNPIDFDAKLEEWRQAGYDTSTAHGDYVAATGAATPVSGSTPAMGERTTAQRPAGQAATGDSDTIKVMEERLRVGKREVAGGAVRIRSYVVERPVEEKVSLHEEHVEVQRRPVDRAAEKSDLANAFQERTLEARATSEEAVVSKDARVVEEIGLKKDVTDRTETVRDTVRKTEVEVEGDKTAQAGTARPATGTGASGAGGVSTPGATTSGTNTPRR